MLDDAKIILLKKEFEEKGAGKVKIELVSGRYGNPEEHTYPKACYAKIWLEENEKLEQKKAINKNLIVSRQLVIATRWLAIITAILTIATFLKK